MSTHPMKKTKIFCTMGPAVKIGSMILIADGSLVLTVTELKDTSVMCRIENDQSIGERKNMNLPGVKVDLPVLQEKDIDDLQNFAVPQQVDYIAASFVQSAEDIAMIRRVLGEAGKNIKIIAKIENQEGLDKFDEILEATDGVMVARGDLGMEIPPEKVFKEQKMMIKKCRDAGKPCVVATQMLESMIVNPRPTRAECSDVANAVLDGADCVMLSGETANGSFPRDAVAIMARTCRQAEELLTENDPSGYDQIFELMKQSKKNMRLMTQVEAAASSAVKMGCDIGAKAIIVLSQTGETARLLAKFHPNALILSVSADAQVARQVEGYMCNTMSVFTKQPRGDGKHLAVAFAEGKAKGIFKDGDAVVAVHTMRNTADQKQWAVRILNVTSGEVSGGASPAKRARRD